MEHLFIEKKTKKRVFVLLHGTGGDEQSLLPVADILDKEASVLAIRGEINEYGALRFFKRKAEGVYDVEDLIFRGMQLKQFLIEAAEQYQFQLEDVILLGFSNGANIAIELLLKDINTFRKAILLAPMFPLENPLTTSLEYLSVFISMGENDPLVSLDDSQHVIDLFEERQAKVTTYWTNGHEINGLVLENAKQWLNNQ